jgi:NADH:ubiquinone reductase (H+-translocating)
MFIEVIMAKKKIVILGGGFGGVYTAKKLEKLLKKHKDKYEIILVSRDNYFTYQPMLAEIIGGSLSILDTVSSLRNLLKFTKIYIREVSEIDVKNQRITLSPSFNHKDLVITYDSLVLSLGNVTDFRDSPAGLHEHALPFKSLADTLKIKNRIIDVIENAAIETNDEVRQRLLTFVIGGGGYSGIEICAELNDFVRTLCKKYPSLRIHKPKVVLIHSKSRLVDQELSKSLSHYCQRILRKRGVELMLNNRLRSVTPYEAILDSGIKIPSSTVISTVPSSANPLIEKLPFEMQKHRIATDTGLQVLKSKNVWALGDCAACPNPSGQGFCPPTAQFAIRQANTIAKNIYCKYFHTKKEVFKFKELGTMAALGHHSAVAQLFGCIKLSGFVAWIVWRMVYLLKLPGWSRRIRVALTWALDMILPQEQVQLKAEKILGLNHLFYSAGDDIFQEGDVGDFLYVVVDGKIAISKKDEHGESKILGTLKKGDFFGEIALLDEKRRMATATAQGDTHILALRKDEFDLLITYFSNLKTEFQEAKEGRLDTKIEEIQKHQDDKLEQHSKKKASNE